MQSTHHNGSVSVLLGLGYGTFGWRVDYAAGEAAWSVAIGDLDGDQAPDLVAAIGGYVSVLLGLGDGTFAAPVNYGTGDGANWVAIGDLDGDQVPDLAATMAGNVSVLLGLGDGTFAAPVDYAAGDGPNSVAIGDLDCDQVPDLAVTNNGSDNVSVLLGVGDGTFGAARHYPAVSLPRCVAIGDLDGDGDADLAVANHGRYPVYDGPVLVLLGVGDGTFAAAGEYAGVNGACSVAIGDLDADQVPDLAVASYSGNNASVLLGVGDGTFAPAVHYPAGSYPWSVAIGDLDGDQAPDLAVAHTSGNVAVLLNQAPIPGDVDGDGDVDLADLAELLGAYGACEGDPSYNPDADLDDSGCVDLIDLAELLGNYGVGDCNGNGIADWLEIDEGTSADCNVNGIPDECDIADGVSDDYDLNGVPDECEDCNENGISDACDLDCATGDCASHPLGCGSSADCQPDDIPDECQLGCSEPASSSEAQDDCVDAEPVCTDVVYSGTTSGSTNDGSASCGGAISPDVWYIYTATEDGRLTISLCGSTYDTVLSVHIGCPGDPGYEIACSVDYCGHQSQVTLDVTPGFSYLIRIAGWSGATGDFTMLLTGPECELASNDCNANGVPDDCDIADGTSADINGNGIPDECECLGDIVPDGEINLTDLAQILGHYGMTSGAAYEDGDLDADGDVDLADLAALLAVYGTTCP